MPAKPRTDPAKATSQRSDHPALSEPGVELAVMAVRVAVHQPSPDSIQAV
jgi:hypothetical protein